MFRGFGAKLKKRTSSQSSPDAGHHDSLCKQCRWAVINQKMLHAIPESQYNGVLGLDLQQGYIDVPATLKDEYPSMPRLKASANQGCTLCAAVFSAIEEDSASRAALWKEKIGSGTFRITFRYNCIPELGSQSFNVGNWPTMFGSLEASVSKNLFSTQDLINLVFNLHSDTDSLVAKYLRIHRRDIAPTSLSARNLKLIHEWITNCCNDHDACNESKQKKPPIQPRRLVYVGNTSLGQVPCLMDASQVDPSAPYAALSYCWGPESSLRLATTRDTLEERLRGLPWATLPRTFYDALAVTMKLKLQYIWIDSLCIIQDDEQDWQREAAKMGDIYRNAHITIAAAASNSTNDGFLRRQLPRPSADLSFQSSKHSSIAGSYFASYSGVAGYDEEFVEDVERSNWNNRGWTFQERLLSHRILFFTHNMLHYECQTLRWSENYDGDLKPNVSLGKLILRESTGTWAALHSTWRRIVQEYSRRAFTFEKDRLPALSSIAKMLLKVLPESVDQYHKYVAGHYFQHVAGYGDKDLGGDLLWRSSYKFVRYDKDIIATKKFSDEVAPSWSWCSGKGLISWPILWESDEMFAELLPECRITQSYLLPHATRGFLEIEGRLVYRLIEAAPDSLWKDIETRSRHYHSIGFDSKDSIFIDFDTHIAPDIFKEVILNGYFWFALLCSTSNTRRDSVYGLVLAPRYRFSTFSDRSKYIEPGFWRIGMFGSHVPSRMLDPNFETTFGSRRVYRLY